MILQWVPKSINGGPPILTSLTSVESTTLCRLAEGKHVLEVGSAFGYSAILMSTVAESVLAIDPHNQIPHSLTKMDENIEAYGAQEKVDIWTAWSEISLPELIDAGETFGLIFIDGDHSARVVRRDIKNSLKLLDPGGVIACHDYGEETCPGVKQAVDDLNSSGFFENAVVSLEDTLWVVQT